MGIIQNRTETVVNLKNEVEEHCMCLNFKENRWDYTVYFPLGFRLDGARASKSAGKANALTLLLKRMELEWVQSYPKFAGSSTA